MKRIAILGVLVIALMSGLLVGCTGGDLTQQETEQMVTDVLIANAEVGTCKFDMSMQTTIEVIGGSEPVQISTLGNGTGVVDSANKEMHMDMIMTMDIPDEGKQEIPVEYYLVDGWMHTKIGIPGQGEQWMKMEMPEEMWETSNQLSQQLELLEA